MIIPWKTLSHLLILQHSPSHSAYQLSHLYKVCYAGPLPRRFELSQCSSSLEGLPRQSIHATEKSRRVQGA
ncbi:hypothetical protein BRADI_4g26625v3 [Brachypodium distachyon]|uniref:Uncharacterized protein n=1 Tax=Brachypodium distachyon TaxID=15368 RepID=A0A2K2CQF2_BRADI|nr:hypothetical protein BRADI_4g26625v3 [Brachypodium distachyon]